jgi:hypothetical protein
MDDSSEEDRSGGEHANHDGEGLKRSDERCGR